MKKLLLCTTFVFLAVLAAGCSPTAASTKEESKQEAPAAAALGEVKAETKEAVEAVHDFAVTQKREFVDQTKSELLEMQNELDRLSAKVENSRDDIKADAKTKLDAVRLKLTQVKAQLAEVESSAESAWDAVKSGFEKSRDDLKTSVEETRQWLSDKIEPEPDRESV